MLPDRCLSRLCAAMAALAIVFAQTRTQTPEPDTVIRINVNLVQVDAVVTDSKDRPVTNLQVEDFEILQDGKPQKITNFSYITTREAGAPAAVAPPKPAVKGAPPLPPAMLKPTDVRRTVALVVDDLGLSFDSMARVRQALKKFVDQEMRPGDLVAIIRTGAGMGALQQFTADKSQLHAAIDRVKFNAMGRVGISSFKPLGTDPDMGSDEANAAQEKAEAARSGIVAVGSLGAVRFVVDGLRELPGRKAVILFSQDLRLFNNDGTDERALDNVHHLTDAANRSSVVIYSVDPRGLQTHQVTAEDNPRGMTAGQISEVPRQRAGEELVSQDGLSMLASETGGLFLRNWNDIDGAVRKVMEDSEGYYLIGYHPDASTFDAKTGQTKFHRVSVRLKQAGLHVRTRTGFFGTSDRESRAVAHTREAEIAHALSSPFGSGDIHVRLTPLFTSAAKQVPYLNTMLFIDTKDLKFTSEPDGNHKAVVDLVAMTFGDSGQAVDTTDRTYTIRVDDKLYEHLQKQGLLYRVSHPLKKAGAYQMRIVVRDASSGLVGSANQFIEVPDVTKGRLTLSSLVLQEMQADKPQGFEEHAEGQVAGSNPQGSPAVRIFKRGTSIIYGYQVLNAQVDSDKRVDLTAQTRLFRDGQQVYAGKAGALSFTGQTDPKRLVTAGSMKLGAQIAPGDYVLQVIVTDRLAKEKYRTATEWMDFEIQP